MNRELANQRFILSTRPTLWLPLYRDGGGSTIVSSDGYGHVCTVTGTTWGIQGRTFNGLTDIITCAASPILNDISSLTALAWINPTSLGESSVGRIFDKRGAAAQGWFLGLLATNTFRLYVNHVTTALSVPAANNSITLGVWQLVGFTWTGGIAASTVIPYKNGAALSVGTTADGVGARQTDAATALSIGNEDGTGATSDGTIGDCLIFNEVLTATKIQQIYLATKWRY